MSNQNEENTGMSKYELKKLVNELEDIRGRNTELVSLYIPAGYEMSKISEFVTSESSEAENIKSKHTRKNVQGALDKIARRVKEEPVTPENGVVFFSGNVSEREGRPDIQIWEVHPPKPIESRRYRCDKEFQLEPLKQMIVDDKVYGLIVADKNEAAIGYLQGNRIKTAYTLESNVPGKTKAGGQCLDPDSMVQMSNGDLKRIDDVEVGDRLKSADFNSMKLKDSKVKDKWREEKTVYKIETKHPKKTIKASGDHEFFIANNGVEKKQLGDLEDEDELIFPERVESSEETCIIPTESCYNSYKVSEKGRKKLKQSRKGEGFSQKELGNELDATQAAVSKLELGERDAGREFLENVCDELEIDFREFVMNYCRGKDFNLPSEFNKELAQILGYFAGDGSFDPERLNFHESDEEVAKEYQEKLESVFNCSTSIRFREDKNYYLLIAFGKPIVEYFNQNFPELKKSRNTKIPEKVLKADEKVLSRFIKGFYDAEGHCSESRKRIGISANNKSLIRQLQSTLLRLEVVSSFNSYDNSENPYSDNTRYTVSISDQKSIRKFKQKVGFTSIRKQQELEKIANEEKAKNHNRQIISQGSEVRIILENHGKNMEDYKSANTFLQDKRKISKKAFNSNFVQETANKELKEELKEVETPELLPTKIESIEKQGKQETVDISVEAGNFVANNLVVHNSAQRFARFREEMYDTFLKDIAEKAKNAFMSKKRDDKLLGIIVGGPGFTKDKLIDDGYLHKELEEKIVTRESLNYSGEDALEELVSKAEDSIEDSKVIQEKNLVTEFFKNLKKENGKSEYGVEQVEKALKMGAVETLLISEDVELYEAQYQCECGNEETVIEQEPHIEQSKNCSECNKEMELEEMQDIIDAFGEKAEEMSSGLEIIGTDHEEGKRLSNMGGVAAILRYRIR